MRTRKRSVAEAADVFAAEDMDLLETEYKDNKQPMKYRCRRCGHEGEMCLKSVLNGHRCRKCCYANMRGEGHYRWISDREDVALRRKIVEKCHGAIRNALLATGKRNEGGWLDLLGYTPTQLRHHVLSHPNWRKIGNANWHLDHRFPIKAFIDYGIHDIREINALENLQPLPEQDNRAKAYIYDAKEFERYLRRKGLQ